MKEDAVEIEGTVVARQSAVAHGAEIDALERVCTQRLDELSVLAGANDPTRTEIDEQARNGVGARADLEHAAPLDQRLEEQ